MLEHPSADHIARYREQGFLAVEGFLDAGELAAWREHTTTAVAARLAQGGPPGDDYYHRVFTQCIRLADEHAGLAGLVLDRRLAGFAGRLAGVRGLRLWHDQALFKGPYGHPTGWHLDCPFWSFDHADAITVWVALEDATVANGCLWYLPGTHRDGRFEQVTIGPQIGGLFQHYPEWTGIAPVPVELPAGGAVFHNGLTAHAAGANLTGGERRAMTVAWMPDGAVFNGKRNVLPDRLFDRLRPGDRLDDAQQMPLLWEAA